MKIAYIEWMDARRQSGQLSGKAAREQKGLVVTTAGILVGEGEEYIREGQDWWSWEDDDGTAPETFREVKAIPKVLVVRMVIFETGAGTAWVPGRWELPRLQDHTERARELRGRLNEKMAEVWPPEGKGSVFPPVAEGPPWAEKSAGDGDISEGDGRLRFAPLQIPC